MDKLPPENVVAEIDRVIDMERLEATLMAEGIAKFAKPQKALWRGLRRNGWRSSPGELCPPSLGGRGPRRLTPGAAEFPPLPPRRGLWYNRGLVAGRRGNAATGAGPLSIASTNPMAIDIYSPCPGGSGKKIKFCCPDFLAELNEIDRLLEGEQFAACLQRVDQLLERGPARACLLATRGQVLAALQRFEDSRANAEKFLQCFPDNPVALAESAVAAADDDRCREALDKLERAMAASGEVILHRVYEAIGVVADALIDNNEWLAARWLLLTQCDLLEGDEEPHRRLLELSRSAKIPLLLRVGRPLLPPPDGALGRSLERGPRPAGPPGVVRGHRRDREAEPRNFPTRPRSGTTSPWCEAGRPITTAPSPPCASTPPWTSPWTTLWRPRCSPWRSAAIRWATWWKWSTSLGLFPTPSDSAKPC